MSDESERVILQYDRNWLNWRHLFHLCWELYSLSFKLSADVVFFFPRVLRLRRGSQQPGGDKYLWLLQGHRVSKSWLYRQIQM